MIAVFQKQYVILDKIYKKDIDYLHISEVKDNYIEKMYYFSNLSQLDISYSEINSQTISQLFQIPNLNDILFIHSSVDFSGAESHSPEIIHFALCDIANLKGLADCSSLIQLEISETTIEDKLVITDDTAFHQKYSLKDSSDFAYLDNLETLGIYNTQIEDISGFMEMDSLKTLTVSQGYISEENIKTLKKNDITVIQESEE
ncbi:MAG: hypothetical protein E7496_11410 [Ruminococcus sp.]|nr:hypothetical protein [Ruminococcus sp.]